MIRTFIFLILIALVFVSCNRDDNPPEPLFNFQPGEGYFILNEGGFTKGNASVDFRFPASGTQFNDLYESANGEALGDVLQSGVINNGSMYLVVNNSGYIRQVDIHSFEKTGEINGMHSPRYMQIIRDEKAYVSDLYANRLWVIDLTSLSVSDSIQLPGRTEEMVLIGDLVYVTSPTAYGGPASTSVYVIDTNTDTLVETLEVGNNPMNILAGQNGWIHVFCLGDAFSDPVIRPSIHSINSSDRSETRFKKIPNLPVAYQSRLRFSPDEETLYLLYGNVYEIDNLESGLSLTSIPLIEADARSLYGLEIDPQSGNLFITDAVDYNSQGMIYEYRPNAVVQDSFPAGVIPGGMIWY
jgi:DNA-binding beta-propeller fold protein YncE